MDVIMVSFKYIQTYSSLKLPLKLVFSIFFTDWFFFFFFGGGGYLYFLKFNFYFILEYI